MLIVDIKTGQPKKEDHFQMIAYKPLAKEGNINVKFEKEGHIYRDLKGNQVYSVTQINSILSNWVYTDDEAMKRGNYVHKMTELFDKGRLDVDNVKPEYLPYLKQWIEFKKKYGLDKQPSIIEQKYISKYGYTGTIDRVYPNYPGPDVLMLVYLDGSEKPANVEIVKYSKLEFSTFLCFRTTYIEKMR